MSTVPLPTHKAVKDVFDGMLGRDVGIENGLRVDPAARPAPSTAVYVDDRNQISAVVLMDFPLTAYVGAALGLVPPGGAEAAIEDREISPSLQENTYEMLNVLSAVLNGCSQTHQRLSRVHRPGEPVPADVAPWQTVPTKRLDLRLTVKGYGSGLLNIITLLDG
jgi:hypothetical protein